jgi:hypothetical protein
MGGYYTDQFELRTCRRQLLGSTSCNSGTNYFYIVTDHTGPGVSSASFHLSKIKKYIKEKGFTKNYFDGFLMKLKIIIIIIIIPAELFGILNWVIDDGGTCAQSGCCPVGLVVAAAAVLPHVTLVFDGASLVSRLDISHARSVHQIF